MLADAIEYGGPGMTTPDRVLIERWQRYGDADARNALVERYRGLVRALAARYADRGEPFDDLVQVAWIGLLKAIDRFDSSRDVQLTTYATPTIVGEIKRHYRDRAWAVHVPRSLQELRVRVHATIDRITSEKGRRRRSSTSQSSSGWGRRRCSTRCTPRTPARPRSCRRTTTSAASGGWTCPSRRPGSPAPTPGSCSAWGCSGSTSGSAASCTCASTTA